MFEPNSRYHSIPTATHRTPEGEEIAFKRRRFLPRSGELPELGEVTISEGDRLDLIASRTLGEPESFWQIADANDAMDPAALTATPGRRLRITMPRANP